MKTMKINDNVDLSCDDRCERYTVSFSNYDKRVFEFHTQFSISNFDDVQDLVWKLFRLKMITPIGDSIKGRTTVDIVIWNIDETDDLYIETYHDGDYDEVSDFNMIMKYDEFLNLS